MESQIPSAGTISVCLPGLLDSLQTFGIEGTTVDHFESWNSQFASAQVVHIHGWDYPLAVHAARAAKRVRKPYILSPLGHLAPNPGRRENIFRHLRNFFTRRPLVRGAAAITALNEPDQEALRTVKSQKNLVLLPYGICFRDFEESAADAICPPPRQKLLVLGPLDPLLGCVAVLKAFAELGQIADDWTVTLAGDDRGNWRGKLGAAVRRKGGENRVTFEDATTLEDQKVLLGTAAILVAPSLHVSPAVPIMQALTAGVPVIATKNAAPPGLNGEVRVCGSSRAELCDALRSVMEMPPGRRRESARIAREKARSLFDWSVLAPRYSELYTACMQPSWND